MSIIALSHVLNDYEVRAEKGWNIGYRLMDTETEKVLDVPFEAIVQGALKKGLYVRNLKVYDNGAIQPMFYYASRWTDFATIEVSKTGEHIIEQEGLEEVENMVFVTGYREISQVEHVTLLRVTDIFGRAVKQVTTRELDEYESRTVFRVSFDDGPDSWDVTNIWHKQAKDYMKRTGMLTGIRQFMADTLNGGAELYRVDTKLDIDVTIPDFITVIGAWAFRDSEDVRKIRIGKGVKTIREYAFCRVKTEGIEMNTEVEEIRDNAFEYCDIKGAFVVPESAKRIEIEALCSMQCDELIIKLKEFTGNRNYSWLWEWARYINRGCDVKINRQFARGVLSAYFTCMKDVQKYANDRHTWVQELGFQITPIAKWRTEIIDKLNDTLLAALVWGILSLLINDYKLAESLVVHIAE